MSNSPLDPLFDKLALSSANTTGNVWRRLGIAMPPGAAERFGQVVAEFLGSRKDPERDAMFNIGMTRLLEIIAATEAAVPGGKNDPAFLDAFAAKLRAELDTYERPDRAASA